MKPDEELKQIAEDIFKGKIYTDQHCGAENAIIVFMPLGFMKKEDLKKMQEDKISMLYEYIDKAMPRSVNGMPIFSSMGMLTGEELKKMCTYHEKIKKAVEAAKEEDIHGSHIQRSQES